MKTFKEYAQNKDIEVIKSILVEEGYEPTAENINLVLEAGMLDRLKDSKLGKAAKGAMLAGAIAGAGMGQASAQGIRQVIPSRHSATQDVQSTGIRQVIPSRHSANSIESHWKQQGDSFAPRRGNGVILKGNVNVSRDSLTDQTTDYAHVNTQESFKTTTAKGMGLNLQDAIKDALQQAARQGASVNIDSETLVKNDELIKDRITSGTEAIIGKFEIVDVQSKDGLTKVTVKAEVQKRTNQKASGAENFRTLNTDGKFQLKKTTLNLGR
jgi:hypothetical protein